MKIWHMRGIAIIFILLLDTPDPGKVEIEDANISPLSNSGSDAMQKNEQYERATFGAGCFWGVEAAFAREKGVIRTTVGYMGGTFEHPTYENVCSGTTGHAEVVEVVFDPTLVTYDDLLGIFWEIHNPTTRNRQGPDVGAQYRSVIFYHSGTQRSAAEASKEQMDRSGRFRGPIVTDISPAGTFWRAEEYHQQYFKKHGRSICPI